MLHEPRCLLFFSSRLKKKLTASLGPLCSLILVSSFSMFLALFRFLAIRISAFSVQCRLWLQLSDRLAFRLESHSWKLCACKMAACCHVKPECRRIWRKWLYCGACTLNWSEETFIAPPWCDGAWRNMTLVEIECAGSATTSWPHACTLIRTGMKTNTYNDMVYMKMLRIMSTRGRPFHMLPNNILSPTLSRFNWPNIIGI